MFVPLCDHSCFCHSLVRLKSPQHALLSSLLVSLGKLTASLWLGGVMALLSVKTTVMNSIVLCAQSPSSSVPVGSALTVLCDAMEMQTARINQMRRTAKVSTPLGPCTCFLSISRLKLTCCFGAIVDFGILHLTLSWAYRAASYFNSFDMHQVYRG
jgi:hypothetical protein